MGIVSVAGVGVGVTYANVSYSAPTLAMRNVAWKLGWYAPRIEFLGDFATDEIILAVWVNRRSEPEPNLKGPPTDVVRADCSKTSWDLVQAMTTLLRMKG